MSGDDRVTAVRELEALKQSLAAAPSAETLTRLVEECTSLISAVETSHMEAIRFRMYNLRRQLDAEGDAVPSDATTHFGSAVSALEAAGFQTK